MALAVGLARSSVVKSPRCKIRSGAVAGAVMIVSPEFLWLLWVRGAWRSGSDPNRVLAIGRPAGCRPPRPGRRRPATADRPSSMRRRDRLRGVLAKRPLREAHLGAIGCVCPQDVQNP